MAGGKDSLPQAQLFMTQGGTATEAKQGAGPHLENDSGRLGVVPQGDAEEAEEGRLGLVGLRASSTDDTGP